MQVHQKRPGVLDGWYFGGEEAIKAKLNCPTIQYSPHYKQLVFSSYSAKSESLHLSILSRYIRIQPACPRTMCPTVFL